MWIVFVLCLMGLAWALRCSYWVFFQAPRDEGQYYGFQSAFYGFMTALFGIGAWWSLTW